MFFLYNNMNYNMYIPERCLMRDSGITAFHDLPSIVAKRQRHRKGKSKGREERIPLVTKSDEQPGDL